MADEEDPVPEFEIRSLQEADLPQALTIWGGTGMFQGIASLKTYLKIDPGGLWVASTSKGEVLGSCAAFFARPDLAYLGFYAVQERMRGRGVGGKILSVALNRLKTEGDANCALNTAVDHLPNYRDRAGFAHVSHWQSGAFVGPTPKHLLVNDDATRDVVLLGADEDLWESVLEYDCHAVHGVRRDILLELTRKEESVMIAVCLGSSKSTITGYGIARQNVHGQCMVGPLYADDYETALSIVKTLCRAHPSSDRGLILMTLDNNPGSLRLAEEECSLKRVDRCTRLFKRFDPKLEPLHGGSKVFAQHDLNFLNF